MPDVLRWDGYGHLRPNNPQLVALTAGAVSTTAAGTIAPTTSAGAAPTVTAVTAFDQYGTFTLTPVTGGGAQAAGAVAKVFFANGMPKVPTAVMVTIYDQANAAAIAATGTAVAADQFSISTGVVLVTAHLYTVTYVVLV